MQVRLSLVASASSVSDVVVDADPDATVGDVARVLARGDVRHRNAGAGASFTLAVQLPNALSWSMLPPDAVIGESWLTPGSFVQVWDVSGRVAPTATGGVVATVRAVSGPGVGQGGGEPVRLEAGSHVVGRAPGCELQFPADLEMSKRHARIDIGGGGVEVVDLGSTNGVEVDGRPVQRLRLSGYADLLMGRTVLRVEVHEQAGVSRQELSGVIAVKRAPRVEVRYAGQEFPAPPVPRESEPQPFPLLAMIAPVLMGGAMYAMTGRLISLVFIAMSPVMMLGNWVTTRRRAKRVRDKAVKEFEEGLADLSRRVAAEQRAEHDARVAEVPDARDVLEATAFLRPLLWTRRPEHWAFMEVCLGRGPMPSRNSIDVADRADMVADFRDRLDALVERTRVVPDVPLVASWAESGAIGVAGTGEGMVGAVNGLLVQITGLHSPAQVVVAGLLTPMWAQRLNWVKWTPHAGSLHSPLPGEHLAGEEAACLDLLGRLEDLVEARAAQARASRQVRGALDGDGAAWHGGANVGQRPVGAAEHYGGPLPVVLAVIADDAVGDRARLVELSERAADVGVFPLWVAETAAGLPAVCRTFLDADAATVSLVRLGEQVGPVTLDLVQAEVATKYGRHLGRLVDGDVPVSDETDLPSAVALAGLIDPDVLTSQTAVLERWVASDSIHHRSDATDAGAGAAAAAPRRRRRAGRLRAIVGASAGGVMQLDLRAQGPHALVGGTTGSGKSEFLQAWVLGMAAECSPDRVTFLFVDYKGGAAFADCVHLPHCVGLVTDLSPHLVRRALTSLRAELAWRERLLHAKDAKDLLELEERGDVDCPPALVIVIDEFAALVGEVPQFVDGVVDVAQRGRSLGIHLIMATQRPAGVIKDNLRANTNLRVALRMADEADSKDVVGSAIAAHFDATTPGRAVAKSGPGRLTRFQSGYAGGWSAGARPTPRVVVHALPFGRGAAWPVPPELDATAGLERDLGPTDQERMVALMRDAAAQAQIPAPRRPWLDELADVYDLTDLIAPASDTGGTTSAAVWVLGMSDVPQRQAQEPCTFRPDTDGHLQVIGASGTGKTVLLRTIAAMTGLTTLSATTRAPDDRTAFESTSADGAATVPTGVAAWGGGVAGDPVRVYALDFASGGLRMLEGLPHVGAVVMGEDTERVVRVLRMLGRELEDRTRRFAATGAATLAEYRAAVGGNPHEPRIVVLLDGFAAFNEEWATGGMAPWFRVLLDVLSTGRSLGMHVVLTVDRPGVVPGAARASIQRTVVLRLADKGDYGRLQVPEDALEDAVPGRGLSEDLETQLAVFGGSAATGEQAEALTALAERMRAAGVVQVPGVGSLPDVVHIEDLGAPTPGRLLLGLGEVDLDPVGIDAAGSLVIAGPPQSGRSALLRLIAHQAVMNGMAVFHVGPSRSTLATLPGLAATATNPADAADLARALEAHVMGTAAPTPPLIGNAAVHGTEQARVWVDAGEARPVVLLIEQISSWAQTPADSPLQAAVRAMKAAEALVVGEGETTVWTSMFFLGNEVRADRRGILLQPETNDGLNVLRTEIGKATRADFPIGRGVLVSSGRSTRIQFALVEEPAAETASLGQGGADLVPQTVP